MSLKDKSVVAVKSSLVGSLNYNIRKVKYAQLLQLENRLEIVTRVFIGLPKSADSSDGRREKRLSGTTSYSKSKT